MGIPAESVRVETALSSKLINRNDSFCTLMFYVALFPLLFSAYAIFSEWPTFTFLDFIFFLGMGFCSAFAPALIGQAFRIASPTLIAPYEYTALI